MAENLPDEALTHTLQQMGMVTLDQLEAARLEQAGQARQGLSVSLGEVLIQQGVITSAILENVTKKIQTRAAGGIKQLGQYKLTRKLGEGAMGQVYLAEDTHVGRIVAIKVLQKKLAENREFLTRFRREAQATGKLNHVNIVCAYTVGEEQGVHYYAMEYCDGEPLNRVLKRVRRIPWDLATGVIMQVARGLKHAHEHGIIHRDIKPENVFICRPPAQVRQPFQADGAVEDREAVRASGQAGKPDVRIASPLDILAEGYVAKILDLGLSKDMGGTSSSFLTQTGVAMGTPVYISPEQAKGEQRIDGRTDIYSLGATFYHLVTGEIPFKGTTAAIVMMKHISEQLPNLQDLNDEIPDSVAQVVARMMAKDPAERYANCMELLDDLELVIDGKMPSHAAPQRTARPRAGGTSGPTRGGQRGTRGPVPPTGPRRHEAASERHSKAPPEQLPPLPADARKKRNVTMAAGVGAAVLLVGLVLFMRGGRQPEATSEEQSTKKDTGAKPEPVKPGEAPKVPPVKAEPPKFAPDLSRAVDLLPMIGPQASVNGRWSLQNGALVSDWNYETSLPIPWQPPEEYDFRIEFARMDGNEHVFQNLYAFERVFRWVIGASGNTWYTFDPISGKFQNKTTINVPACLENGKRYVSHVQVRKTGLKAYIDGKLICEYPISDYGNFGRGLKNREPAVLGLGSSGSPTTFFTVKVLEITGKGKCLDLPPAKPATVDDAFVSALDALPPNEQFQRIILRLQDLNVGYNGVGTSTIQAGSLTGISLPAAKIGNLAPLRAVPWLATLVCSEGQPRSQLLWDLSPLKGLELVEADFNNTNVVDLSPLQGMKLRSLKVANAPVSSLSPLAGMPLAFLDCSATFVGSLTPLAGLPLTSLACSNTRVRDLSPLKGMPLTSLDIRGLSLTDLSALKDCPLQYVSLDFKPERDLAVLKAIKTLVQINGVNAAEFLQKAGK